MLCCVWLWPQGACQEPARFLSSWNFPGKDTGVGCHFLLSRGSSDPRIEPKSSSSPVLAGGFFTSFGRAIFQIKKGFLVGASGTESASKCRKSKRCSFHPWVEKIPWGEGHENPLQYSCLENSHGQRSLEGYKGLQRAGHDWGDFAPPWKWFWNTSLPVFYLLSESDIFAGRLWCNTDLLICTVGWLFKIIMLTGLWSSWNLGQKKK